MTDLGSLQALSDADLIAKVATNVMKWTLIDEEEYSRRLKEYDDQPWLQPHEYRRAQMGSDAFNPLTNWNDTMQVEGAVKSVHVREDIYVEKLWQLVYGSHVARLQFGAEAIMTNRGFHFVHATRHQRCLAALLAVSHE